MKDFYEMVGRSTTRR